MTLNDPIYLIDECLSAKSDFVEGLFIQSIDAVGRAATDDQVLAFAKENSLTIVTEDHFLVIRTILEGLPVVYHCTKTNNTTLINATVEQDPKFRSPINYHLLESEQVVIP